MPEWASTTLIVVVTLLIFVGMWAGWRARVRRDAALVPPHDTPDGLGEPVVSAPALYVATTRHGQPLERLAIRGLGFRAQGMLAVYGSGVAISLDGNADVWLQASVIVSAEPAQVAIDKVVEKGGLLTLSWRVNDEVVDSYFRVFEPEKSGALYDAIDAITSTSAESEV
ncbi:hypothetical protein ACFOYW_14550 [Gryllotalpicola reticulitermitis]|uniref:PH domain-containing protein n=1 Tax=Gryllotalpicola reticulitermitis TaxID=1184153 RepID=A0ABV8Q8C1_9MICO